MEDKKKPYIKRLQEELDLYKTAIEKIEAHQEAEAKVGNTSYVRDAMNRANDAYIEMKDAIARAKSYSGGVND